MKTKLNYIVTTLIIIFLVIIVGCSNQTKTTLTTEEKTTVQEPIQETQSKEVKLDVNCDAFSAKLDSCIKYKCQFKHPLTGDLLVKEIVGIVDGKCNYIEAMPNNGKMECKYNTESMRKALAQYYKDVAIAESAGTEVKVKYTIDGKEVANPLQEAMTSKQCVISGY